MKHHEPNLNPYTCKHTIPCICNVKQDRFPSDGEKIEIVRNRKGEWIILSHRARNRPAPA